MDGARDAAVQPKLLENADRSDPIKFIAANDLLHVKIDGRSRHYFWENFVRSLGRPDLPVDRGLVFDTEQLAVQYAVLGDGVALSDPLLFAEEIKAGRLAQPFDLWLDEGYGYYLTTHPEDLSNEAVALFRSWLIARFSGAAAVAAPRRGAGCVVSAVAPEIEPVNGEAAKRASPPRSEARALHAPAPRLGSARPRIDAPRCGVGADRILTKWSDGARRRRRGRARMGFDPARRGGGDVLRLRRRPRRLVGRVGGDRRPHRPRPVDLRRRADPVHRRLHRLDVQAGAIARRFTARRTLVVSAVAAAPALAALLQVGDVVSLFCLADRLRLPRRRSRSDDERRGARIERGLGRPIFAGHARRRFRPAWRYRRRRPG